MSVGGIWSYINIIKLNCVNLYNKESGLCLQAFCIHSVVMLSSSQSQKGTPLLTLMKDPYIIIAAGKGVVVHSTQTSCQWDIVFFDGSGKRTEGNSSQTESQQLLCWSHRKEYGSKLCCEVSAPQSIHQNKHCDLIANAAAHSKQLCHFLWLLWVRSRMSLSRCSNVCSTKGTCVHLYSSGIQGGQNPPRSLTWIIFATTHPQAALELGIVLFMTITVSIVRESATIVIIKSQMGWL